MTTSEKQAIVAAASRYMEEKNISQNELQRMSGVSYLSYMLNEEKYHFQYPHARTNELQEIAEKWFVQLAKSIGFTKEFEAWPMVITIQATEMLSELEEAKNNASVRMLLGVTGCGKTYIVDKFKRHNPQSTYIITCHRFDHIENLVDKIIAACNIRCECHTTSKKIAWIASEMTRRSRNGEKPILIFDEAENLKVYTIQMLKALYDVFKGVCSLTLVGTPDLLDTLEKMLKSRRPGVPQFFRRVKIGIRILEEIERDYNKFFAGKAIEKSAQQFLREYCENYGELADCLEPLLKNYPGQAITREMIKTYHKI